LPPRQEPQVGLGRAIRQLRSERGLSQEELASRAELSQTWVSHLESGRINPTWSTVRRLAGALSVTLPELAALADQLEPRG
jgi:transcriptional regulator with XRE-family HTH domain